MTTKFAGPQDKVRCAARACGLITELKNWVERKDPKDTRCTTVHCPRCLNDSYYNVKPGEIERPKTGAQLITLERNRQILVVGYDAQHDDEHTKGDLSVVAAHLAVVGTDAYVHDPLDRVGDNTDTWGLTKKLGRYDKTRIQWLVVAGALIAAEIDRLQRRQEKDEAGPQKP